MAVSGTSCDDVLCENVQLYGRLGTFNDDELQLVQCFMEGRSKVTIKDFRLRTPRNCI